MRSSGRLLATLAALAMSSSVALAIEPRDAAPPPTASQQIALDVVRSLAADNVGDARSRLAIENAYRARANEPLWVDASGLNERGRAVVREIAAAGDWGLDAAKFDLELPDVAGDVDATASAVRTIERKVTLAVLSYALHAKGGRVDPAVLGKNWDQTLDRPEPVALLTGMAAADDPAAFLRDLHPKHAQFEALRKAYLELLRGGSADAEPVNLPDGPTLRSGERHPHVAILRKRLGVPAPASQATNDPAPGDAEPNGAVETPADSGARLEPTSTEVQVTSAPTGAASEPAPVARNDELFDDAVEQAVLKFQRSRGLTADGVVGPGTRKALNSNGGNRLERLLVNMERWRWMPADLGTTYVHANVPEYRVRVMRDGAAAFDERMVVGKVQNQTPIFSDAMERIEFHPYWNVPNSIKVKELLPGLRTSSNATQRHNLRIKYNGQYVDPGNIDWDNVDVRKFHFYQPPGDGNVLGFVKFMFPNKHDVYMHDTPSKSLFEQTVRTYSHGCMRIRNPRQFAETLLGIDKGWAASRIGGIISAGQHNVVPLDAHIPVHVTYFTARVNDDGELVFFGDPYGHDRRHSLALSGKPLPALASSSDTAEPAPRPQVASNTARPDWVREAFTSQR